MTSTASTQRTLGGVRFFKSELNRSSLTHQPSKAIWMNVGEHDSGFRAVAAGLIDRVLSGQPIPENTLKTLLNQQFKLFPQQKAGNHSLLTTSERMQQLVRQVSLSVLIQSLAYTLRQIAVDELCRSPETYPLAFANGHRDCSPEFMRQPETNLDEFAIAALARALGCTIQVSVVEPDKPLPLNIRYLGQPNFSFVLQRQGDTYMPRLKHGERFKQALQNVRRIELPIMEESVPTLQVTELTHRAYREIERIYAAYQNVSHSLKVMLEAHEQTQNDLLSIYLGCVAKRPTSTYAGTEYGNQAFFNAIIAARSGLMPVLEPSKMNASEELIHGIAMAVSFEQISLEEAFESVDAFNEGAKSETGFSFTR
ncbi:hypothetical protein [Legionella impletisoli]|uniref:Uncharacterized protein n=1 Tax=Legionella impletisoli TaxID=343510 RepID=A0A917JWL0_9GAMM|nr:hypothetical protein [Legionella impletisoli]GGI87413.1 hypothetical protein GCM10007966_15130 [Legionella impletisoli]